MGIIFSKPREYVARKVDACKTAIHKKVDDTKSAIVNRIHSSVQSVKHCLVTTKDDIVGSVVGVKDNVCGRISRKVNCVCDACRRVHNNVIGKVNYATNSVINAKNSVVGGVVSTRDSIVNTYVNTTNYIRDSYTQRRNAIKQKYSDIKNAKLTRWQKLKYSIVGLIILWIMYIIVATSFDVYIGDFTSIEERFCSIRDNALTISYDTYTHACTILVQTFLGLRWTLVVVWKYSRITLRHTHHYMTEVKKYCYDASKDGIHYVSSTLNLAFETLLYYLLELASHVCVGTCYLLDLIYKISLILSEHVICCSKIAWEHLKVGSKVAYKYSKVACSIAFKHSSMFLKDVSTRGSHYLYYLMTDFKHASVDGLLWSWGTAKLLTHSTIQATIEASHLASHYSSLSATLLHQGIFSLCSWSYETSFRLSYAFLNACFFINSAALDLSTRAYEGSIYAINHTYETTLLSCLYLHEKACTLSLFVIKCSTSLYQSVIDASFFIYHQASYLMNEYGFDWLQRIKDLCSNTSSILLKVLQKFFSDLALLLFNLVTITADRLFNITYFFFFVVFTVLRVSFISFKFMLSSLVLVMKLLFAAIVTSMQMLVVAYSSFLSSYNHHRESIFFSVVTLLSVYCVSVAKERKISEQQYLREMSLDDDEGDDDDDDDDVDDDGGDDDDFRKSGGDNQAKGDGRTVGDDDDLKGESSHGDVDFDSSFSHDDDDEKAGGNIGSTNDLENKKNESENQSCNFETGNHINTGTDKDTHNGDNPNK